MIRSNVKMCWDYHVPRLVAKKGIMAGEELLMNYQLYDVEEAEAEEVYSMTPLSIVARWNACRVPMNNTQLRKAVLVYLGMQ